MGWQNGFCWRQRWFPTATASDAVIAEMLIALGEYPVRNQRRYRKLKTL